MAYLAPALAVLRSEINAAHPGRDKTSDGWIGDAAHASRTSDHNPRPPSMVVDALDVDKDGMDKDEYRRVVLADDRTEYFIQDGIIYSRSTGFRPQKYTGSNGHYGHGHTSLRHGEQYENDTRPWGYKGAKPSGGSPVAPSNGKSIAEVADEVIAGKWGSGEDRKRRLSNAGYSAATVQAEVNRKLGAKPSGGATKSVATLADEVQRGLWGSGDERKRRLGSQYAAVQAEVNRRAGIGSAPPPAPAGKSVSQLADEVQRGEWGNGPSRSARLLKAGYNPGEVQAEVNRRAGIPAGQAPQPTRLSLSAVAQQVIAGQWGNGTERRTRLANSGFDANAVQAEVNRLMRR